MKKALIAILAASLLLPFVLQAKIGVGVGTGKIILEEALHSGLIYTLPSFTVINTGDEPSRYGVGIQYLEGQQELKASPEWFDFSPKEFYLEPGKAQTVDIKLTLPVEGVRPGDYFVFLQGFPLKRADVSGTSLGIAAASKLYFKVSSSNLFAAVYYRAASLVSVYSPWSYVLFGLILLGLIAWYLSKNLSIGISLKRKSKLNE